MWTRPSCSRGGLRAATTTATAAENATVAARGAATTVGTVVLRAAAARQRAARWPRWGSCVKRAEAGDISVQGAGQCLEIWRSRERLCPRVPT